MENQYNKLCKYIFNLLTISGIYVVSKPTRFSFRYCIKIIILCFINALIYSLHFMYIYSVFEEPKLQPMASASTFMIIASSILKTNLYFDIENLKVLTMKMSFLYEDVNKWNCYNNLYWINFWVITNTLTYVFEIIFIAISNIQHVPAIHLIKEQTFLNNLLYILYSVTIVLWHFIPLNAFSIYYTLMCHQMKFILLQISKFTKPSTKFNFQTMLKLHTRVRCLIKIIDQKVSFFVLLVILYNAAITYCVMSIFESELYDDMLQMIPVYILCLCSIVCFMSIVTSAPDVYKTSIIVSDNAEVVFQNNQNFQVDYLLFCRSIDKEITMTVWRTIPIKRGLEIFGTYLTCCYFIIDEIIF